MDDYDEITTVALRARHGDAVAASAFVRATQVDVWRLCAHLGSTATADDLTPDTYARAFASLHRFLGRSSARTWLLSIARRVWADAVRDGATGSATAGGRGAERRRPRRLGGDSGARLGWNPSGGRPSC